MTGGFSMFEKQTVKNIMTSKIISVLPGDSVQEAAKQMQEHDIGSLPVISAGSLRGILTDRDIVLRCVAQGKSPEQMKVSDIMTKEVVFLTANQPIGDAEKMMEIEQVRRLPVVDRGIVQGMVSVADIARYAGDHEIANVVGKISTK